MLSTLVAVLCVLVVLSSIRQRLQILEEVAARRTAAHASQLRLGHTVLVATELRLHRDLNMRSHIKAVQPTRELASRLERQPPCGGRRFASLSGQRVLHIECSDGGKYAIDQLDRLIAYHGPVRVASGETIAAFCGSELNLLSHPVRRGNVVSRADALAKADEAQQPGKRPSLLLL